MQHWHHGKQETDQLNMQGDVMFWIRVQIIRRIKQLARNLWTLSAVRIHYWIVHLSREPYLFLGRERDIVSTASTNASFAVFTRLANTIGELRFMTQLAHVRLFRDFFVRPRVLRFQLELVLKGFHLSGQQSRICRNYEQMRLNTHATNGRVWGDLSQTQSWG